MKTIAILSAAGTLLCAAPALAADTTPTTTPSPQQQCKAQRTQMGKATFAATYGTNKNKKNAFGKCVSARSKATDTSKQEAEQKASAACTTEQSADPAAFAAKYGKGKKGKNAYAKCVKANTSADTKKDVEDDMANEVDASKTCAAEQAADPTAFTAKYGKGKKAKNAFAKCVSAQSKEAEDQPEDPATDQAEDPAKDQADDPAEHEAKHDTKDQADQDGEQQS